MKRCTIRESHCQGCGSTDREDLETGDQGYSACCNEPVEFRPCGREHDSLEFMI